MSEDNNNAPVDVGESAATVESVEPQERNMHAKFGKDRIGDALSAAKDGPAPATPETATIEQLLEVDSLSEGGHKGLDFNRVVKELPDDAQKLMANLRADYTRKTQALAEERKALESMRTSLTNSDFNQKIDEVANADDVQLDPYDDNSFNARIEQEVARRLQEMMKPIRMEQEMSSKRQALDNFKRDNPDLMDYKGEVAELLQGNDALSLQDAYYIVKGRKTQTRLQELESENKLRTEKMREAGLAISAGTNGGSKPPKGLKGYEVYKWLRDNPKKK
jgi:hypothetical protein